MENKLITQKEIIDEFMGAKLQGIPNKIENNATEKSDEINNTVVLPNKLKIKINPTKIKYFKSGDFALCKVVKQFGVVELITNFMDGYDILARLLSAILDKPYKTTQVLNEETKQYTDSFVFDDAVNSLLENELSVADIEGIIETAIKLNKIDSERFFARPLLKKD